MKKIDRKNLLDRMIRLYGFENELIIEFARMCEEWAHDDLHDKILNTIVDCHEAEFAEMLEAENEEEA